jgi:hypothetical protein
VYTIHYADGTKYVGQSTDLMRRRGQHARKKFENAEGFTTYPMPGATKGQLNAAEQALMDRYNGINGGTLTNLRNAPSGR